MPSVADFFERHLSALQHKPLLAGYEHYDMTCEIHFLDRSERWRIDITNGCISEIRILDSDAPSPQVRFDLTEPVFWDIVEGAISPQKAFFTRKTNIKGDLFQGMKLAKLLSLFFEQYPYRA